MSDPIPPCSLQQILAVEHAKAKNLSLDIFGAVRAGIGDSATPAERVSVASRLVALTNLLLLQPELQHRATDDGSIVNIAILRAAARAPLFPTERPALLLFDLDSFLAVLAEESGTEDET